MAAAAVTRAQNRAVAKGTDPKAATCRAKLQRARSALNRQMDRELRLREGAENLLRATTKDGGGGGGGSGDNSVIGGRNKSKNRKLIRQTVALELSFLESNVRLLADELAELNGSVDVYQYRDEDDDDNYEYGGDEFDGRDRQRRRQRQMPMIAVPLKDTRPIDFGPPLERFVGQHYGVDLSTMARKGTDEGQGGVSNEDDDGDNLCGGATRRRSLTIREAIDELTQLRVDTQTPSRDADGVRLLLRYYRQLYYVDRRFFPPSSVTPPVTTTPRYYQHQQQDQQHYRHNKQQQHVDTSSPPPAIYFEWYDSFGGPVPSCGQRTVRFEQACVLFNVAAVHTQMGAKYDRRCLSSSGGRDDDDTCSGNGKPVASSSSTSTGPDTSDGASAAAQCFLRAAGAYRHIGDTFANAPAQAADLRATGVLYAVMMAQANECVFEKLQWRLLASVRHRCRRNHGNEKRGHRKAFEGAEGQLGSGGGDRRACSDRDAGRTRRTSAATTAASGGSGSGMNDAFANTRPSWTELAREAAHVSRMYAEVVYNSCRPNETAAVHGGKENGSELSSSTPPSVLPEVWVAVCRIKDRHYAALAYRYAACALLPYYRCNTYGTEISDGRYHHHGSRHRDRCVDGTDAAADQLLTELMAAAAAAGLELPEDDETTSTVVRRRRLRKQIGKLLLDAAAATHERAARAQRLCRQLRAKAEGNAGGGLLAGVLDRERQRTVRLLMLHRRRDDDDDDNNDEYVGGVAEDENSRCCCRLSRQRYCGVNVDDGAETSKTRGEDFHDCWSDDECADAATDAVDHCSGDQDEFTGIAGIPGLDVDRGVLIRPRTRFRLMAIAPDFTDTGDSDEDREYDAVVGTASKRQGDDDRRHRQQHEAADREERRVDLFAGLGPVAVFSARHRHTRPRWVKVARAGRHRTAGDMVAAVGGGGGGGGHDEDDEESAAVAAFDPIQLVDRWFGFELRSHGGGTAAAVPPATVGHVRPGSQAQMIGLRRGDIVVALKCTGDGGGSRVLDVRWDTCRRVAELVVHNHQRRRAQGSAGGGVQLKIVTPITAVMSDGHVTTAMDTTKTHHRRRTTVPTAAMSPSLHSVPPPPQPLPQSAVIKQQQRRQRRQTTSAGNEVTDNGNKLNTWSWNPFRRRRRSVVGNKC